MGWAAAACLMSYWIPAIEHGNVRRADTELGDQGSFCALA